MTAPAIPPRTVAMTLAQACLLAGGLPRGPLSPLPIAAPVAQPEDRATLMREGLLGADGHASPDWSAVAAVLAAPDLEVLLQTGGPSRTSHLDLFAGAGRNLLAVAWPGPSRLTLAWPMTREHVLALLTEATGLDAPSVDPGIRLELSEAGFLVLAAALDALREEELDAMLARRPAGALLVSEAAIQLALQTGARTDDARWLTPIFRRVLPVVPDIDLVDLPAALAELVGAAILHVDGPRFALVPDFEAVRLRLQAPLGWAAMGVVGLVDGVRRTAQLSALRTLGALWGIETAEGRVRFVTTEPARLLTGWHELFDAVHGVAPAAPTPAPTAAPTMAARFCSQCGGVLKAEWKFCGHCGAAVATAGR